MVLCIGEDETHLAANVFAVLGDVHPVHQHASFRRLPKAVDEANEGRFAAAIGTDNADTLLVQRHRNAIKDLLIVEGNRDVVKINLRHGGSLVLGLRLWFLSAAPHEIRESGVDTGCNGDHDGYLNEVRNDEWSLGQNRGAKGHI